MSEAAIIETRVCAPRANPELIGHGAAERTLLEAFASGRLPHAWLLTGPRGIGKATLAYRFARFVLAGGAGAGPNLFGDAPQDLAIDPEGPVFHRIAAGGHPDLRVIERSINPKTGKLRSETVVEDVRPVVDFLRKTAAEGGWRVVIADPVDDLNPTAANALLKVLEEPPAQVLLLLVSHAPGRLLPTIRSRCCRLGLEPLSEDAATELLGRALPELPSEEAAALARLSEGSPGRALDLAAEGGLEFYRELVAVLSSLPQLDIPRVHALGDRLGRGADGAAFRSGAALMTWWLGRFVRGAAEGRLPPEVVPGEAALMARLLEARDLAHWLGLWEKTARLFAQTERANLDRKQVVITALLEFEATAA